jgi:hypothetical protein
VPYPATMIMATTRKPAKQASRIWFFDAFSVIATGSFRTWGDDRTRVARSDPPAGSQSARGGRCIVNRRQALALGSPGRPDYCPCLFIASAIFSFTASRLKLAPFCIGG